GLTPAVTPPEVLREVFETNVVGVLMVTNAMLPLLRRSPAARIVNVSSGVGSLRHHTDPAHYLAALPASATYPPSKTALNSLTVQYAKELRADGILVNAAAPGACATDFTKDLPFAITRTAADGAAVIVRLATLGPDGPTGGFHDDDGPVPW
ncbi:SDR family NAD(P)-dependent oxidoreductase, partial [Nonomuraea sp. NPDC004297]